MNEIIDRILDGKFDYDGGTLDFSRTKVEITLMQGESYEGSFTIIGRPERVTEGLVYSSDSRMQCLTREFSGAGQEIGFAFHGEGMEEGDVLKGSFYIISNQGEYTLPFVVMISHTVMDSTMGNIRNLFHFANLAKSSWREAVNCFYSPGFEKILKDSDRQYMGLYRGLSHNYMNEQNVEEFLIAVNKKQKVHYIIDEDKISLEDSSITQRQEVVLTRNGWGYINLKVEADNPFIHIEKEILTDDDFLGNRCTFYFYIDEKELHWGNNYGNLRFYNNFVEMILPVEVSMKLQCIEADTAGANRQIQKEKKQATLVLMDYYQRFRLKKMNAKTWQESTSELVERMILLDDTDPVPKLFQAQLLITQERYNEAGWTLEHAKTAIMQSDNMDQAIWCYYLYLTTLKTREETYINQIADEVARTYERDVDNWRIAWLLLYLSPEYSRSATSRWLFLQEVFHRGCTSPVIYLEAVIMMKAEPALFMELGSFELQVLFYAARHDALTSEMIDQLHYLVPREKNYSEALFYILQKGYEMLHDEETLTTICILLMKGNKKGPQYFKWYALGVEHNLRVTRLYEYYMESLDLEDVITLPRVIFMYFGYNNQLSDERTAFLYANLIRHQDIYPDLYENAIFRIQEFVLTMISKNKMSRNLAYIYKRMLNSAMLDGEVREHLAEILFDCEVSVEDVRAKRVILQQPKAVVESSFPLSEGKAIVPIYGGEYTILFEDADGNRYIAGVNYHVERLMQPGKILKEVSETDYNHLGLQLYLCNADHEPAPVTHENAGRYRAILKSDLIQNDFKRNIVFRLLQFYYDNNQTGELDSILLNLKPEFVMTEQRSEVVRYLVMRDMLEKAADWVQLFGVSQMEAKTLVRLSSLLLKQEMDHILLLQMCISAFERGKYDLHTLQFLMEHFEGPTKILRDIWKTARDKGLDVQKFSEKIILQMLYTGHFVGEKMEILRTYVSGETDLRIETAFLSQCAYDYFVKDKLMDSIVFEDMEKLYLSGQEITLVCMLAYTKFYADNQEKIQPQQEKILEIFLRKLCEQKIYLAYFCNYVGLFCFMTKFYDKTIIEYKARPGNKAVIHYMIEHEENQGGEYMIQEMKEIYGGVCASWFILFFGEKLLYYITEESGEKEELTESGNVSRSDIRKEILSCRFSALNDVVISELLQEYESADELLQEYDKTDYLQRQLFEDL